MVDSFRTPNRYVNVAITNLRCVMFRKIILKKLKGNHNRSICNRLRPYLFIFGFFFANKLIRWSFLSHLKQSLVVRPLLGQRRLGMIIYDPVLTRN